jgi:hypothetical protein
MDNLNNCFKTKTEQFDINYYVFNNLGFEGFLVLFFPRDQGRAII